MEKVTIDELDPIDTALQADVFKPLSPFLETEDVALNYYELAPGDQFGFALHTHHDQEELFYVQEGTVTFETRDDEVAVEAGEIVRFAPGDFQLGRNLGEERVIALALGAPKESTEVQYYRECETCGERTEQRGEREDDALLIRCESCDAVTDRISFD